MRQQQQTGILSILRNERLGLEKLLSLSLSDCRTGHKQID